MTFDYTSNGLTQSEKDSIENNISTIASTPYATAPFIRNMGIKKYPPETQSSIEENQYATEVMSQTSIWEDRAKVTEVHFENKNVRMVVEDGRN